MKTVQDIFAELPAPPMGKTGWPWTLDGVSAPDYLVDGDVPKISIVTPSFNQGQYIEETIRSVLLQGYPDLEYFIVDGGSTDESVEIIRKYEPWLAGWVSEKDAGQTDAINKGFARCTGQVFGFLNSDDLFESSALQVVGQTFKLGIDWVAGQTVMFGEDVDDHRYARPRLSPHDSDWLFLSPCAQPSTFWSRRLWETAGEFDTSLRYAFDFDYWMRLRFHSGAELWELPQVLSRYRLHPSSKTIAEGARFEAENRVVRKRYRSHLSLVDRVRLFVLVKNRTDMLQSRSLWEAVRSESPAEVGRRSIAYTVRAPWRRDGYVSFMVAIRNLLRTIIGVEREAR